MPACCSAGALQTPGFCTGSCGCVALLAFCTGLAFVPDHASVLLCCATVPRPSASSLTSLRKATHWHDLAGLVGMRQPPASPGSCVHRPGMQVGMQVGLRVGLRVGVQVGVQVGEKTGVSSGKYQSCVECTYYENNSCSRISHAG